MPHDPDVIFKALRVVPEFDGKANVSTRFIHICGRLVAQYTGPEPGEELRKLVFVK